MVRQPRCTNGQHSYYECEEIRDLRGSSSPLKILEKDLSCSLVGAGVRRQKHSIIKAAYCAAFFIYDIKFLSKHDDKNLISFPTVDQ